MTDEAPPTDYELGMAFAWVLLNAVRLFHNVPFEDVTSAEQQFLQKWRAIPAERRQAALDYDIPVPTPSKSEGYPTIRRAKL